MRMLSPAILAVAVALASVLPASGYLLSNGNFETGNFTGWTLTPAGAGTAYSVVNWQAQSGIYSAAFGNEIGDDIIAQSIVTTPGMTYDLSFWVKGDGLPNLKVRWNGDQVFSTSTPSADWTQYTLHLAAVDILSTVSLGGGDVGGFVYVDNVTLVPEPGAFAVFGAGLLGLLALRRP